MTGEVLHNAWIVFVFVAYFAILIGIAIVRVRSMSAMSDYVLGRRRLSSFTTALSAGSSTTSGWTMLVFPALAFTSGANQLWLVVFLVIGAWFNWTIVAKRLRRYTISMDDSLTLPEFLERRLRDETNVLRAISAAFTIFFIVFYITSGLVAGSKLLNTQFGLDSTLGLILTLIAVSSYTFIGGFLAVSRTDVFQALLILVGFVIMLATVIIAAEDPLGGVGGGVEGFMNPFTDTQGQAVTPVFVIGNDGLGTWVLWRAARIAALHGRGTGRHDQAEPQSLDAVAVPGLFAELPAGTVRAARARRGRDHDGGCGAGVFPGRGLLLSRGHRGAAADGGDCGCDEHGGFAIAAVVGHRGRRSAAACAGSPVRSDASRRVWLGRGTADSDRDAGGGTWP